MYHNYGRGPAKFKCEIVKCADEKGNHKGAAIFGVEENGIQV
jgi:hypothetical protein